MMRAIQPAEALTEELDRAIRVIGCLFRGQSPRSGEPLPPMSEYDDADVVYALGMAVGLLEEIRRARGPLTSPPSEPNRELPQT